jgi:hypothetical protein
MTSMRSMLSGMERLHDGPDDGGKMSMMALQSKIRELAVPHPDPLAAFCCPSHTGHQQRPLAAVPSLRESSYAAGPAVTRAIGGRAGLRRPRSVFPMSRVAEVRRGPAASPWIFKSNGWAWVLAFARQRTNSLCAVSSTEGALQWKREPNSTPAGEMRKWLNAIGL